MTRHKWSHKWSHLWYKMPEKSWTTFQNNSKKDEEIAEAEYSKCLDCVILSIRLCFKYQSWRDLNGT